jgi:hypothetical protein
MIRKNCPAIGKVSSSQAGSCLNLNSVSLLTYGAQSTRNEKPTLNILTLHSFDKYLLSIYSAKCKPQDCDRGGWPVPLVFSLFTEDMCLVPSGAQA